MDLTNFKNIYMVGIKGVGMAMLAQFLKSKNYNISGSDVAERFPTDKSLFNSNIKVKQGFSLDNFPKAIDLVIYSSAFNFEKNIELKHLKKKNLKFLSYAEALGLIFDDYFGISVCGSHGKSTVSAFLGYVLKKGGLSPNVLSGSYVEQFQGSILSGKSDYLVVESDEYQNKLKYFNPKAVLLNNIDYDHPDYFANKEEYFQVFADFVSKIPLNGFLVFNADDPLAVKAVKKSDCSVIAYSLEFNSAFKKSYYIKNLSFNKNHQSFSVFCNKKNLGEFKVKLFGKHSIYNTLAVISSSLELGIDLEKLRKATFSFKGLDRRFHVLGSYNKALIVDDYAHHPNEIKASLDAVKQRYPKKKIITVFHPHTFSRTKSFLNDFATSFSNSDELYLIEIYSSAREKKEKISSLDLIEKIKQYNHTISKDQNLLYFKNISEAEKFLKTKASSGDLILLLGAGDVFRIGYNLLKI